MKKFYIATLLLFIAFGSQSSNKDENATSVPPSIKQWLESRISKTKSQYEACLPGECPEFFRGPANIVDIDGDGKKDVILWWSFSHYRCNEAFLVAFINNGSKFLVHEYPLPVGCGSEGWLYDFVKLIDNRVFISAKLRSVAAKASKNNTQIVGISINHDGRAEINVLSDSYINFDRLESELNRVLK